MAAKKQQYQLEFVLSYSSFSAMWDMRSTPEGLEAWFADKAERTENNAIRFEWGGQQQTANIKNIKTNEYARFHWEDTPEKYFFEFRLAKNELTGELTLIITDFAFPDDMDDEKQLWESCVSNLCRVLGM